MKDIWRILKYSKQLWPYYVVISVFVIILAGLSLVLPFVIKGIVDGVTSQLQGKTVEFSYFIGLILIALAAGVANNILSNVNGYLGDMMSVKLNSFLSQRYFEQLLKLPVSFFDNEITGKITARLERSINQITQFLQTMSNNFIQFFFTFLVTIVVMAYFSWPIALMMFIITPIYIWLTHLSSKSWQKKQDIVNMNRDVANGRFVESISQVRVVKSFVREDAELKFFASKRRKIEKTTSQQSLIWHKYDVYRRMVMYVLVVAMYGVVAWQGYHGVYSIGTMALLFSLITQAQFPLFGASFIVDSLQRATSDSRDYFEIMDMTAQIADKPDAKALTVSSGKVEYKNVDFAYEKGKNVLRNVGFTIEPGQKIALVGESGEGKSTIANLMLRFYEVSKGHIEIDGQNINDVTQKSLRRNIGVVFQEPQLFSGTVRENIDYHGAKSDDKRLMAAAKAANAWDFIQKLPHGLDTEIGERGVKLSGGQKQRIAIARAIMKNPPILILDEATSSLDSKAEHEVQEALETLMQGRTTMIIAHRLSTIAHVDKIVGLRGGQVAEQGTPAELAKKKDGIYAELLRLQTMPVTEQRKAELKKYDLAA